MSRKDLLKGLMEAPAVETTPLPRPARGAIGAVSGAFADLRARAIEEVPADLIDSAGLVDRLEDDLTELKASLAAYGQQVPVLLRHSPNYEGRYEVIYGRRRVAALRALGLKVRAFVREMNDRDLIVTQGQENSQRRDLSYIEKALFAATMEAQGFKRAVICDALAVDKTQISRLLAVVKQVPEALIRAIGPAPGAGRDRWSALAARVEAWQAQGVSEADLLAFVPEAGSSDARFAAVFAALAPARSPRATQESGETRLSDSTIARWSAGAGRFALSFEGDTAEFGRWVEARLSGLHADWLSSRPGAPDS